MVARLAGRASSQLLRRRASRLAVGAVPSAHLGDSEAAEYDGHWDSGSVAAAAMASTWASGLEQVADALEALAEIRPETAETTETVLALAEEE